MKLIKHPTPSTHAVLCLGARKQQRRGQAEPEVEVVNDLPEGSAGGPPHLPHGHTRRHSRNATAQTGVVPTRRLGHSRRQISSVPQPVRTLRSDGVWHDPFWLTERREC